MRQVFRPIFTQFSGLIDACEGLINYWLIILQSLKGRCHSNCYLGHICPFGRPNSHSSHWWSFEIDCCTQFWCNKIKWQWFGSMYWNLVSFGPVIPEITVLEKSNVCTDTAKSSYCTK